MGYKLTSLIHLPIDDTVQIYVFVIGDGLWSGGLEEVVHRNFDNLAREFGGDAIIVGALTEAFHGEVVQRYLGTHYENLKNELPGLLITDSHPDQLTEQSLRVLIPLHKTQENYPVIDKFLHDIASFARGESDDLLVNLEQGAGLANAANDIVEFSIPIVPGVVGVNLNSAVAHLRKWWKKRKQ